MATPLKIILVFALILWLIYMITGGFTFWVLRLRYRYFCKTYLDYQALEADVERWIENHSNPFYWQVFGRRPSRLRRKAYGKGYLDE